MPNWKLHKNNIGRFRSPLLIGGPLLFFIVAVILYLSSGRYISTDDAYVQAARTNISANVSGRAIEVFVEDNQFVQRGDLLFKLDDRDFRTALDKTKAQLDNAKLQIIALKATYRRHQAEIEAARAVLDYQKHEFDRQQKLIAPGMASQSQLDQAKQAFISAKQNLNAAEQEQASVRASLNDNPEIEVNGHPTVQHAQAELAQAELNLGYTVVTAPQDGIVSKVELLQVGDYINAAKPVFALVSNTDIWVEGNFKETDLTYMRPDQAATISIDTYPNRVFHGKVVSVSPGTGASFSLLPPENATGNWVKVVQRVPVRISIDDPDPKMPLHSGLSSYVEVDTRHRRLGGDE